MPNSAKAKINFGVFVPNPEEHLIKAVTIYDLHGNVYGPYSKMSTSYDLINLKTPIFAGQLPFKYIADASDEKEWKYHIDWFPFKGDPLKNIAVIATENRINKKSRIDLSIWVTRKLK